MDADHFESLLRSLSAVPSRRSALRLLAGLLLGSPLALGIAGADAHNALLACQKKSGKRKRKCRKQARQHNAQHASTCPGGTTRCGGTCVTSTCTGGQHFEQAQCRCCTGFGLQTTCSTSEDCCSRVCVDHPSESREFCSCLSAGVSCDLDVECCGGDCDPDTGECACHAQGTLCTDHAQCCAGLVCEDLNIPAGQPGTCQPD